MSSRAYEAKMRHSSIKKEVLVEDSDNVRDIRLERRLKRRSVANQSLINDSCTKGIKRASQTPAREAIKRTSQTPAREVIVLDEEDYNIDKTPQAVSAKDDQFDKDYKVYLNRLEENRFNPSLEDDDLDPQYKMFWENVREDANSFVLEIAVDKDIHILLKYEEDDRFGGEGRPGSRHNLRTATKSENMENPKILKDFAAGERKTLIDKKLRPDLSKKASSKDLSLSKPKCEHEPEPCDTGIDESYKIFLEFLKEEDNCLTFVNRHGKRVKYEEESESESEMLAAEGDPCIGERKETPCVKSKPFDSSHIKNRNRTCHSQFRDKLMVNLRKPYNQSEYEELLQEICQRKPLERHRDLRGRIKSYSLEICSKSYLDHHTDLKRKIDAVQGDRCKTLNLLRGFFYWLKNLSHEGAFQPWSDSSCLKVMPQL